MDETVEGRDQYPFTPERSIAILHADTGLVCTNFFIRRRGHTRVRILDMKRGNPWHDQSMQGTGNWRISDDWAIE